MCSFIKSKSSEYIKISLISSIFPKLDEILFLFVSIFLN